LAAGCKSVEPIRPDPLTILPDATHTVTPPPPPRRIRVPGYIWPARGAVLTRFGQNQPETGERSRGIDIRVRAGEPVLASRDGKVSFASEEFLGLGKLLMIDHGDGAATVYGHVGRLLVLAGDRVEQGQTIALAGTTGRTTAPTLHFRILQLPAGRPRDPLPLLPRR
jgi:murein DD-endopeptidase MepM/ murein hydrolase activator NlpD